MSIFSKLCVLCLCYVGLPVLCNAGSPLAPVRACVVSSFQKEVGTHEVGYNTGPRVNDYLKASGNAPGAYWCGAFVTWVIRRCGPAIKIPAGPGAARNWFHPGPTLYYVRNKLGSLLNAKPGDCVGFFYANLGRIGHIGFVESVGENSLITVEGNTGDSGGRNGDGVYRKRRMKAGIYAASNHLGA
jgi:hypothetical protein